VLYLGAGSKIKYLRCGFMGEEYRTWVYHQLKSPKGKIVSNFEAEKLYKKG
jgi:hypothetical protein